MDGTELVAWRGFLKAHARLLKEIDSVLEADHRLPLSSFGVLHELAETPGRRMRMRDLAESVALSRSGLSRLVDRLEREGLIEREPCAEDARGAYAVLTRRGLRRLEQARPAHLEAVRMRFLGHFSRDELKALAGYWDRLLASE
jgi:DNA-binding MarR family transcriptional regulator